MNILSKSIHAAAGTLLYFLLFSCQTTNEPISEEAVADSVSVDKITLTDAQYKSIGIEIGSAKSESVRTEVKANGRVDLPPENRATISLPIGGKIRYVKALPGQRVRKGELLATLESFEFIQLQQDFLQNTSQLIYLEKELERQRTLTNENVGARKQLEQAQANYASTKAQVQSLEAKLRILGLSGETLLKNGIVPAARIVSPVNGYITVATINLGKETTPGEVLLEVIDKSHMHVELTVFEQDAPFIKEGQRVRIVQPQGESVDASVYLVGKMLEGNTRMLNIHAHVRDEKQEAQLVPGGYVNAFIETGNRMVLTVPTEAVVRKGATGYVYIQEENLTFRRIPVKIGGTSETGNIEVSTSVPLAGVSLVTKGAFLVDAELAKRSEPEEE
ncbi:efflux RND transporter periplasmic adaptor subunit [Arundinibacter roseus]|uniref:Efflux RND transporter periplasmic adaptor subunit n=1 Tax=Arundinibacter roseus TaxID=2070510 RepID=A0A4R4KAJ3_9BACT|nr:efflux RND transporter periplasmic adaptor subunit [Arundinibacter roseus]TDB63702.1 efflux RND transporter periplasmic adaptor subunit [Arundinibacter roseus]